MSGLRIGPGLDLPLDLVTEATAIVATRGAGKSSTGAVLVEEALAASVPTVVMDWTGVFWGLRSSAKGDGAGLSIYVLGGPHGDVPLEHSAGKFTADLVVDSGHSFVLDLSDFTKGQMRRFAADFLERLYDRKARARTTLLLLIDEAHEFAPQSPRGGFKGDAARLIGAMEQVAALGRSRGIGVVMITQRTQALNKAVLDLIETLIVMRMLSPRAVDAVRGWISVKNEDDEKGVLASLPELPTGTAWVWSPLRGILQKVAVRRIRTFDSYATPRPGEVRVEPKARKELDLDALGEQMRATVERAKADDPAELRRRLATAERDLATERAKPAPEPVVQRVEVPVLAEDLVVRLEGVLGDLRKHGQQAVDVAQDMLDQLHKWSMRPPEPRHRAEPGEVPQTRRPTRVGAPAKTSPARPTPPPTEVGDVKLGKTERNVLTVLALHGAVSHSLLALLSGYSPKASTIGVSMGKLRSLGLVEPGQPYRATQAGLDVMEGSVEPLPEGDALLQFWRHRFGQTERNVLDAVLSVYPRETSQAEVAEITGYSPTASTIGVSLGKLRKVGVIDRWRISDDFARAIGLS